ncbi:MAG: glucose 1-dehydrogenase [Candidatus Rokubacteria bacterium]|nr:glucose 1-dehydrogenase [Candidatus Rokubacteria bacterium]
MGRLENRVALITGGASGIGEATVRLFAAEGARVIIADVQDERGERLAGELGARAIHVHTDVREEAQIEAAIGEAVSRWGRLDCLFNNAGAGGVTGGIEAISAAGFDDTMALLVRGVLFGMKHAAPVMRRQGAGSIVSTASIAGLRGGWGPHVYSAAKAAVIQLTRSIALELAPAGIRVNCICPGAIATPIFGHSLGLSPEAALQGAALVKGALAALHPIGRAGLPEDIARAALWLAGEESSFVTGQAIVVDGGITAGRPWAENRAMGQQIRDLLGVPRR